MLRILKNNNFTPEEVRWRRQIDTLKAELDRVTTEQRVDVLVKTINGLVHQINTLGTNAINLAVAPVSAEAERQRLRERLAQAIAEIVRNPDTPDLLFDKVCDFLVEASSGNVREYWSDPIIVAHALEFHRKKGNG